MDTLLNCLMEDAKLCENFREKVAALKSNSNQRTAIHEIQAEIESLYDKYQEVTLSVAPKGEYAAKKGVMEAELQGKMEEGLQAVTDLIEDIVKKCFAFSTLEMEHYGNLLSKTNEHTMNLPEYNTYKGILSDVYATDQISIFIFGLKKLFFELQQLFISIHSILSHKDNQRLLQKAEQQGGYN